MDISLEIQPERKLVRIAILREVGNRMRGAPNPIGPAIFRQMLIVPGTKLGRVPRQMAKEMEKCGRPGQCRDLNLRILQTCWRSSAIRAAESALVRRRELPASRTADDQTCDRSGS